MKEFTVVAAACGRNHTLFLTDRGTVFACGDNKSGQCGVGNATPVIHTPCRISFKQAKIVKVTYCQLCDIYWITQTLVTPKIIWKILMTGFMHLFSQFLQ